MKSTHQHRIDTWAAAAGLVLFLLAFSSAGAAVLPFDAQSDILSSTNGLDFPIDIALGDLNGNGRDDLVLCDQSEGAVWSVYASGTPFGTQIANGLDSPRTADIGDIDGDGDADVIVGQYNNIAPGGQAELIWYEFDQTTYTWVAHDIFHLSVSGARSIKLADIDNDGDLDFVLAVEGDPDPADGSLTWWENTLDSGTVGFSTSFHFIETTVDRPWDVEVVDLDSDGDLDVVTADVGADTVDWYENDGTPSSGWTSHSIRTGFDGADSVTIADIDRDGAPDVVASAGVDDRISWFENPSWTEHNVVVGIDSASSVEAADMDFDGDVDLVCTREFGNEVLWIENTDGAGGTWLRRSINSSFSGSIDAVPIDMDGDGDFDVAAVGYNEETISWWKNENTHRRFAEIDPITVRDSLNDPRAVAVADINGDGLQDMVLGGNGDAWLKVYIQVNETSWWENTVDTGVDQYRDVSVADMDGDGDLDVLGATVSGDAVYWWANDGSALPTWTQHTILSSFDGAHAVEPVDIDSDGDFDVVVAAVYADQVKVLTNDNGVGTSWSTDVTNTMDGAYDIAIGDVTGDGRPDVVASSYYGDFIRVMYQSGTAWNAHTLTGLDGPRGVSLGDVDGDGDLDIVGAIRNDDDIKWFENDGVGGTWTAHNVGTGYLNDGSEVQAVDIDHDGDIDVLATGYAGDDVYLWTNDGDGSSWSRRTIESGLDSPWQALAADINGDNNMDVVLTAAGTTDSLTWYKNVGQQFVASAYNYSPSHIDDGEKDAVLNYIVMSNGRSSDDNNLEISSLQLEFTDKNGAALTSAQINNIVERMEFYLDADDNLIWDAGVDTLLATDYYLSLSGGLLTYSFSHGISGNSVAPEAAEGFFVVLTAASDASQYSPNQIIVTMKTDQLECADRSAQTVLIGEAADDQATGVITIGSAIFSDGFETGNTSAWSSVVGS